MYRVRNQVCIVMYHYVRELPRTSHPRIKGLLLSEFRHQIEYFRKYHEFVTVADCIAAVRQEQDLPPKAVLLTFDDGFLEHYTNVFPILDQLGVQGCFFPPARAIRNHEVLEVNKIQFLLASIDSPDAVVKELFEAVDEARDEFSLESNDHYVENFRKPTRWDDENVGLIKKLLQRELPAELRSRILGSLFARYVSADEAAFSEQLYMSMDQMRSMQRNGMYIGSHCYDHVWLNSLEDQEQAHQIDLSLEFLRDVGSPTEDWVMCYPHGGYDERTVRILRERRCAFALTTRVGIATVGPENAFELERLDTNDFPKAPVDAPNRWTAELESERQGR
ncbi:MAG: polysaccharide deacetylase family protein [Myxococcota bacterium]|nr:polysaccharide deacetylase family protein [Myxococcota bacterium]